MPILTPMACASAIAQSLTWSAGRSWPLIGGRFRSLSDPAPGRVIAELAGAIRIKGKRLILEISLRSAANGCPVAPEPEILLRDLPAP